MALGAAGKKGITQQFKANNNPTSGELMRSVTEMLETIARHDNLLYKRERMADAWGQGPAEYMQDTGLGLWRAKWFIPLKIFDFLMKVLLPQEEYLVGLFDDKIKRKNPYLKIIKNVLVDFIMKKVLKLFKLYQKLVQQLQQHRELEPPEVHAPLDVPAFAGAGLKPAAVVKGLANVAEQRAAEATFHAGLANRAAEYAAAEAASADQADADAQAARAAAMNASYTYSMAASINRHAGLLRCAIIKGRSCAETPETQRAKDIANLAHEILTEHSGRLKELRKLVEQTKPLQDGSLSRVARKFLKELEAQMQDVWTVGASAERHLKTVVPLQPKFDEPPVLPVQSLRPDGTPWWPDKIAPLELPPRMVMFRPRPGVWMKPSFL